MPAVLIADLNDILARLGLGRRALESHCRANGVLRLDAFGSAVRGDFDSGASDLDLVVHLDAPTCGVNAERYFALKEGLERLVGREVDLLTAGSVTNSYPMRRIDAEKVTLFAA